MARPAGLLPAGPPTPIHVGGRDAAGPRASAARFEGTTEERRHHGWDQMDFTIIAVPSFRTDSYAPSFPCVPEDHVA